MQSKNKETNLINTMHEFDITPMKGQKEITDPTIEMIVEQK